QEFGTSYNTKKETNMARFRTIDQSTPLYQDHHGDHAFAYLNAGTEVHTAAPENVAAGTEGHGKIVEVTVPLSGQQGWIYKSQLAPQKELIAYDGVHPAGASPRCG